MDAQELRGRRVLVVEDDYYVAADIGDALRESGAEILGPAARVSAALQLINEARAPDCAVLDINLGGELVYPVAEELSRRGIPFVFATGYDTSAVPLELRDAPQCNKPLDLDRVLTTLGARLRRMGSPIAAPGASRGPTKILLDYLAPPDRDAVAARLRRVELARGDILVKEGEPIRAVYFFDAAVATITAGGAGARSIEIAMLGAEGMTDMVLRAGQSAALRSSVMLQGAALRMEAADFLELLERPGVAQVMLAYKQALEVQFAYAALAHGTGTIEARLARWILMAHDRVKGDTISIVHSAIADLLAVRRSGVTTALHVLEGMGSIKSNRGEIIMKDRAKLEQVAGAIYGPPEAEYDRLLARASHIESFAAPPSDLRDGALRRGGNGNGDRATHALRP